MRFIEIETETGIKLLNLDHLSVASVEREIPNSSNSNNNRFKKIFELSSGEVLISRGFPNDSITEAHSSLINDILLCKVVK